jgi:hypothetical protein
MLTTADAVYYTNKLMEEAMSSEGHIPVNASDLPIDTPPLEESSVYDVVLKKVVLNPKRSNPKDGSEGVIFCKLQCEVVGGDFDGAFLPLNYLPLPVLPVGTKGEIYKATKTSVPFGRFCRAFKITGEVPPVNLGDIDSMNRWQDWISQFYESTGKVTIRNQEFPAGSGRSQSGINDFLF